MELHSILIRAFFAWVLLWLLTRLSGKETVSQLSGRTLAVTLVLSDLPGEMAFADEPAANFVVAAGAIVLVHAIVSLIGATSDRAHDLIEGPPALMIANGRRRVRGMRRERINEKELAEMLRIDGIDRHQWDEIQEARLEREGQVSVLRRAWARALQRKDLSRQKRSEK